ncbi:MAG: hypothetical protein IKK01_08855 [Clostridia bacterium]|nr:hypothetical protein [Clostridia bacterium]
MAKVKKHRKHKPQPPPLSGLDKFLYIMLVILHFALIVAAAVLFVFLIPTAIAYADESIVAFNNSVGALCVLPICFFWLISGIALYELGTWLGQPLFGNKNYKSKNDIPVKRVYPLFSKAFWQKMRKNTRSLMKAAISLYVVIFIICAAFVPFGLCPRYTLDSENRIKEYNAFNSLTETRTIESAEKLIINISKRSRGRHWITFSYQVQISFVFNDEEYFFVPGNFDSLDRKEALEYIVYLKSLFKDKYEITNIERFTSLLDDNNYTAEEEALVYKLYDYNH